MASLISVHATAPIDEDRILMLIESWYRWLNLNIGDQNLLSRETEFNGIEFWFTLSVKQVNALILLTTFIVINSHSDWLPYYIQLSACHSQSQLQNVICTVLKPPTTLLWYSGY